MKLRTFSNPRFLEQIGRGMLAQLLDQFAPEFARQGVALPEASLDDEKYYTALARLPQPPERFVEALHGIEVMATEDGRELIARSCSIRPCSRQRQAVLQDFACRKREATSILPWSAPERRG